MKKNYCFADTVFEIESHFDYFSEFAKDYETSQSASIKIKSTLELVKKWANEHADCDGFSFEYIETLVIHSLVADKLALENKFIFHGSCIALDDFSNAYIFSAPSGTGKSTHVNLLKQAYGDRIKYINDDKPFIFNDHGTFYVYGSPWNGKERLSNNVKGILKAVFILKRNPTNKISNLTSKSAVTMLASQMHFPKGNIESGNALNSLINLTMMVPIYQLEVNTNLDAGEVSFDIMKRGI